MISGIINIYKEAGMTSHDVVWHVRRITGEKKAGHTGTLDPDAVGVLPVALGKATKVCSLLTDEKKVYEAVMRLGVVTDTQDASGSVLCTEEVRASEPEIREAVGSFVGSYDQIPPMYSAKKVRGKKLYELAREGIEVERSARTVTIENIEITDINLPDVTMRITCSKGTYIRTLCHDIGRKLSCGAHMAHLTRCAVGIFRLEDAVTLDRLKTLWEEGRCDEVLKGPDSLFEAYPACRAVSMQKALLNGNRIAASDITVGGGSIESVRPDLIRLYLNDGTFAAIYRSDKGSGFYIPEKMFV